MGELYKRGDSQFWWMTYMDDKGKRQRRSTGTRIKANAEKILARKETDVSEINNGIKTRAAMALQDPIDTTVEEYFQVLCSEKTEKYAKQSRREITEVAEWLGWEKLQDVDAAGLARYVAHLQKKGRGARTRHSVITAVRTWCNWCIKVEKMAFNPVGAQKIEKPKIAKDRRHERRMLLHDEWGWLQKYLTSTKTKQKGQKPLERMLMYWLAIETGLRASEIRSLTKAKLKNVDAVPYVECEAQHTKNGQTARQYISDVLAKRLKTHLRKHKARDLIFYVRDPLRMAEVLGRDLRDARAMWSESVGEKAAQDSPFFLAKENAEAEVLDFHALRHTCGAWYVIKGISLPEVQLIMRHSTITLTIDTYGHLAPGAESRHRNVLSDTLDGDTGSLD